MRRFSGIRRVAFSVIIAAALIAGGFYFFPQKRPHNLIVISIDTLRADRLGTYGYKRNTSPVLDAFADDSVIFENTVGTTSWTLPSHMSLFTGLYPTSHGVIDAKKKLPRKVPLLAEILKRRGYRTFAFTGGVYVGRPFGFGRGFEMYTVKEKRKGLDADGKKKLRGFESSIARAEKVLSSLSPDEPYFLFLHTYDVHCPNRPPGEYVSMFKSEEAKAVRGTNCGDAIFRANPGFDAGHALTISDRYDGTISWVDSKFQRLIDFLKARGDLDRTVIVFTSDHGEEFYERQRIGHKATLNKQVIMIPLVIRAPGFSPSRVNVPVSQIDIFSTVLDLLDVPVPSHAQGTSLLPLMKGDSTQSSRQYQFSELQREASLRSLTDGRFHLIHDLETSRNTLYDMNNDPDEKNPITDEDKAGALKKDLFDFISGIPKGEAGTRASPDKSEVERLKTLGYL